MKDNMNIVQHVSDWTIQSSDFYYLLQDLAMVFWGRDKGIILVQLTKVTCKPELQGKEKQILVLINKTFLWALLFSKKELEDSFVSSKINL